MAHTQHDPERSDTSAKSCRSKQRNGPASGADSDGERTVEVNFDDLFGPPAWPDRDEAKSSREGDPEEGDDCLEHDDLFGAPAPGEEESSDPEPTPDRDPFASNTGEPLSPPSLAFTAPRARRALYEEAFRAAYRYPDALMIVMQGVRKGLKRGKEAAQK